jgi:SAM-dependent methyltransferase
VNEAAEQVGRDLQLEFAVLQRRSQVDAAANELGRRGLLPPTPTMTRRAFARLKNAVGQMDPAVDMYPDPIKSWDVLRTIEALSGSLGLDDPVLDVGSVACPILPCMHRLGYRRLTGIDLDKRVQLMPYAGDIEYVVEDLTKTTRANSSFAAITAVSVIEHGVGDEPLLTEVARLLRPGGIFIFSTDYWPEKVDTSGISLFGLPWRIFSLEEVEAFLESAAQHGLTPSSDPGARLSEVDERPVSFAGRSYTFLYGALVRA